MNEAQTKELEKLASRVNAAMGIEKWKYFGGEEPQIMLDTSFFFPDRVGLGPYEEAYKKWTDGLRAFNEKHNLPISNSFYQEHSKNTIYQYDWDASGGHVDAEGTDLIIHGSTIEDLQKIVSIIESDSVTFQNILRNAITALPETPKSRWRRPPTIISGTINNQGRTGELPEIKAAREV